MTCFKVEGEGERARMDGECDNPGEAMMVYLPAKVIRGAFSPCSCPDVPSCCADVVLSGNVDVSSRVDV